MAQTNSTSFSGTGNNYTILSFNFTPLYNNSKSIIIIEVFCTTWMSGNTGDHIETYILNTTQNQRIYSNNVTMYGTSLFPLRAVDNYITSVGNNNYTIGLNIINSVGTINYSKYWNLTITEQSIANI